MQAEWIDLLEEDRAGRVRWANPKMSANLRSGKNEKKAKPPPVIAQTALNGEAPPEGEAAAGWRVSVWWKDDMCFYAGLVEGYSAESGETRCLPELHILRRQKGAKSSGQSQSRAPGCSDEPVLHSVCIRSQCCGVSAPELFGPRRLCAGEMMLWNRL